MVNIVKTELVEKIAKLVDDHKGIDTLAIDVREECSWTDYMVIATVRSQAHLGGLSRHIEKMLEECKIKPLNHRRNTRGQGWFLIDCGDFVIHLMEEEQREFYELEKLWFKGRLIYQSSKSS